MYMDGLVYFDVRKPILTWQNTLKDIYIFHRRVYVLEAAGSDR